MNKVSANYGISTINNKVHLTNEAWTGMQYIVVEGGTLSVIHIYYRVHMAIYSYAGGHSEEQHV